VVVESRFGQLEGRKLNSSLRQVDWVRIPLPPTGPRPCGPEAPVSERRGSIPAGVGGTRRPKC